MGGGPAGDGRRVRRDNPVGKYDFDLFCLLLKSRYVFTDGVETGSSLSVSIISIKKASLLNRNTYLPTGLSRPTLRVTALASDGME